MKQLFVALLSVCAVITWSASAELKKSMYGENVQSLRGITQLEKTPSTDELIKYPREQILESNYVYQPPLIPHKIRGYEVSLNANKCLSCHSWKTSKIMGATKVSVTHYVNREDAVLADMSPRRYFCLQCHVPQANTKPVIKNVFETVDSLKP
ncbi:nitrate reductase cytochrome c-type subunit [Photobacterium alginatilyticum]|uniref:Periplasmic nitrate reductase, electron transfer subunit n=1 Tax=Photobacterium alginatilyticum TaxID=1775171 RepID=A0ABW9YP60_9GAMM|nr:nitrate reductase cytochrome c-type subunit [Photobacterium alginatilyticum]NBI54829.1 nitrate reductase cytochrome c-type subunit [Photobacterium alginatilyticum]